MDKIYDFDFVFHGVKDKLLESDLVVGNLETVFAGEEAGYTNDVYLLILRIVLCVR